MAWEDLEEGGGIRPPTRRDSSGTCWYVLDRNWGAAWGRRGVCMGAVGCWEEEGSGCPAAAIEAEPSSSRSAEDEETKSDGPAEEGSSSGERDWPAEK